MIEIRKGELHDIAAIEHVFISSTLAMEGEFYSKSTLIDFLQYRDDSFTKQHGSILHYRKSLFDNNVNCLVACDETNKLVGFIYMHDFSNMKNTGIYQNAGALIMELYVFPSYFRQNIGVKLLQAIEKIAIEQKITHLNVASSLNAEAFYIKQGYTSCKAHLLPADKQALAHKDLTKTLHKHVK